MSSSTPETIATLTSLVEATSNWLYDSDGGDIAPGDLIKEKLKAIVGIADPVRRRMEEHRRRPEQVKLVKEALGQTKQLVELMEMTREVEKAKREKKAKEKEEAAAAAASGEGKKADDGFDELEDKPDQKLKDSEQPTITEELEAELDSPPTYSPEDISDLQNLVTSLTTYLDEKLAEQEKLPLFVDPVVTVKELEAKVKECNKKVVEVMGKQMRAQEERERKEKERKRNVEKERKKKEKEEKERRKAEKEKNGKEGEKDGGKEKGEKKGGGKKGHDEL